MKTVSILLAMVLMTGVALAANTAPQDVNITVNRVTAMEASGPVTLVLEPPGTAGDAPVDTDETTSLWYTSVIPATMTLGTGISVKLDTDTVPTGTKLSLKGTTAAGNKVGNVGTVTMTGFTKLTTSNQSLAEGIMSCYTGRAGGDGIKLSYKLEVENWVTVRAAAPRDVTVVFTMTP